MSTETGTRASQNWTDEFPRLYHAHHARHMEDLPFWMELAAACDSPILELGCGTGRVLLNLAHAGHQVVGLEIDVGMLAVLKENLADDLTSAVALLRADFTRFHLARRFNLLLLPCNTYSTLRPAERLALLSCVAGHLEPDGVFVASLPNPALLRQLPAYGRPQVEETFPHPVTAAPVQVTSSWKRTPQGVTIYWEYDYSLQDEPRHISRHVHHYRATVQDYLAELHSVGFHSVMLYGDYDHSAYHREAQNLIILAGLETIPPG